MNDKIRNANSRALALASFYILESLMLELTERKQLMISDAAGLLRDASRALAAFDGDDRDDYLAASQIVEAMRDRYERLPDPDPV